MNEAMNTVAAYLEAFRRKDMTALRRLLHENFRFRGPLMSFDGPDAYVEAMRQMPFEISFEGSRFAAGKDRVAHAFVWKVGEPANTDIPMCEFFEIRDGKIHSTDLFYDSKLIPPMPDCG